LGGVGLGLGLLLYWLVGCWGLLLLFDGETRFPRWSSEGSRMRGLDFVRSFLMMCMRTVTILSMLDITSRG
jgi:hypothetical protein